MRFQFRAPLWLHAGEAAWYFVTLPTDIGDEIDELSAPIRRGFGSVRVKVRIGSTTWDTSVFPDTKAESYVLPVKKLVRTNEGLGDGDLVEVTLDLRDFP